MHYLEAEQGCSIGRFASDLLKVNKVVPVCGNFEGYILQVGKQDTVEDVINQFWEKKKRIQG